MYDCNYFRIFSGPKTFPGVFIETVRPGALAEDYGLGLGDQIVKVNGKSFIDIKHEEVIIMSWSVTKATIQQFGLCIQQRL